jgi:hypothetical protein
VCVCGSYLSCIESYGEGVTHLPIICLSFCEFDFFGPGESGFGNWFGSLGETKIWIFFWYLCFLDDVYVCVLTCVMSRYCSCSVAGVLLCGGFVLERREGSRRGWVL